jgi:hypothetical protein
MAINPANKEKEVKAAGAESELFPDGSGEEIPVKSTGKFSKIIIVCVTVGFLFFAWVAFTAWSKNKATVADKVSAPVSTAKGAAPSKDKAPAQQAVAANNDKPWLSTPAPKDSAKDSAKDTAPVKEVVKDQVPTQDMPEPGKVTPGITDIGTNRQSINNTPVSDDTFVKDLNGLPVETQFKVENIQYTIDFVSYTKKRAATADGIELYWLDAEYKGKPAKIQVPFKIFKELDLVGVTVVDVEVTTTRTKDNKKVDIVTGFTVRPDYKQVLEKNKKK